MERPPVTPRARTTSENASIDSTRRSAVLETAASLIATSGLRTSMHEIADAAGIQPGSLYHHFDSKEALLVELLRRYHRDLDRIAEQALAALDDPDARPGVGQITALGAAVARCAVANRAAIQISMYETPSANAELIEWTRRRPTAVLDAVYQTLRAARWAGSIGSEIDLRVLADRICQSMLQVGLDVVRHNAPAEDVATLFCRIIFEGLAAGRPSDADLDRSAAFLAANDAIAGWTDDTEPDDRVAHIRAVARSEFGRRGYEGTTIRDIAAAAGMGHGTVFRHIGSKEELLASIMGGFGEKVEACAKRVLRAQSTPVEKLDALGWVNINALQRFGDEFRIQLAWMRQIPPDAANPSVEFPTRLKQTKALLAQGIKSGEIKIDDAPREMLARCIISLQWMPENIVADIGATAAQVHLRDTLLRGVASASG
ncbi:hypothetical protein MPRM_24250 [Mycobacterium parmense]|uniref:HTH tetR-type domain-containing protein n=1 Tax=Mycobacterium parmense TaxID=185642 RepID=A0A7I7YVY4_9MYCO|nr:hypothetical protein MPRM_24250 [Mycobacterium parmense]